jgi:hypothetical protein
VVHRCSCCKDHVIQPKTTEKAKEYGRGNRVRKQVNYCDDDAHDEQLNLGEDEEEP